MTVETKAAVTAWPAWSEPLRAARSKWAVDKLIADFGSALAMTRESLERAAVDVRLIEEGGGDLDRLGYPSLIPLLRRIAFGQVLPEVAAMYRGSSLILSKVTALPLPEQERLATDEPIEVAEQGNDGSWTKRMMSPSRLTPREANQVFASDHVRDLAEQQRLLQSRAEPTAKARSEKPAVYVDDKRRVLVINVPTVLTAKQLLDFVRQLS